MKKTLKSVLALTFCIIMIASTVLVTSAVGNISNLKASNVTLTSATISWTAASGATGYELQYTTGSTTKKVTIKGKNTTSYKLTLSPGKSYTVKVRSYYKLVKTTYGKQYSITVKSAPPAVTNLKATNVAGGTSVKLSWTKVSGATGYVVQQYKNSKWTNIKTTTSTAYTVTKLTAGTTYKFRVAAYQKYSGKNYYSSYVSLSATPTYLAPTSLKVTKTSTSGVTLTWGAVSGAKKYQIYNYNTKKYVYSSKASVALSGLEAGTEYKVRVRGYAAVNGKNVYGAWTSYLTFTTTPDKVTNLVANDLTQTSVSISFDKAPGALGYQVFLYDYATKKETKLVKQLTTNTYDISGLTPGSTYRIGVCSYVKNGSYYYSAKSYVYIDTAPAVSTGAETTDKDIQLEWTKVRKATSYKLERYNISTNEWTLLDTIEVETPYTANVQSTEKETYTHVNAGENKGELYRITAYNGEAVINTIDYTATTNSISLSQTDYSVTVNWNAPADTVSYKVFRLPVTRSGGKPELEITNSSKESLTINLAPDEYYGYTIYAYNSSKLGTQVASFTVKSNELVIDNSDASKTAQLLMLVEAINKTKLYQGDVTVKADTSATMILDAIYFSDAMVEKIPGAGLWLDNGEVAGEDIVKLFQFLAALDNRLEDSIPEIETTEKSSETIKFSKGFGTNEKGQSVMLKRYVEPSGTDTLLAYLYDANNTSAWSKGFSSVKTTYYPATGKYKVVATLKQEKFGTTTSKDSALYHPGLISIYDALGFSGEGVDNELTTLGATTITAYIDAEGRVYSYTVTSPFTTKFMASGGDDIGSFGTRMSGSSTLTYKFTF